MKILEKFNNEELKEIKNAIETGRLNEFIERRINATTKHCPVCTSEVEEGKLTLHFEENNMRKKASFCGKDCLQYFLNNHTKTMVFDHSKEREKDI